MATTDKHPPKKSWIVGKRVKPDKTNKVGTVVRTASGSKRIKPGDGSKPVTKTVGPYMNRAMEAEAFDNKRKNSTVARRKKTNKLPKGMSA